VPDPNVTSYAPHRTAVAVLSILHWLVIAVMVGFLAYLPFQRHAADGHTVTSGVGLAVAVGVGIGVVVAAIARGRTIRLVVDRGRGVLEVHNFYRTVRISAKDLADADLTVQVIMSGRGGAMRRNCIQVETTAGRSVIIQASYGTQDVRYRSEDATKGMDPTIEGAVSGFCTDHAVRCDFSSDPSSRRATMGGLADSSPLGGS
jgi:hypothetical protein